MSPRQAISATPAVKLLCFVLIGTQSRHLLSTLSSNFVSGVIHPAIRFWRVAFFSISWCKFHKELNEKPLFHGCSGSTGLPSMSEPIV